MDNLIISTLNNHILTITINRAAKKNALTKTMYQQLHQLFQQAENNADIHCLIIQGNDACFCAGNDLQDFIDHSGHLDNLAAIKFIKLLPLITIPIIACVSGPCIGIGTTLLLHCDIVIATNSAIFKLPFTQLGLSPEAGSSYILSQRLGYNKAFELLVLGETFNAETAIQYGLINQVCAPNALLTTGKEIATRITNMPLDAVKTSKKLIKEHHKKTITQCIDREIIEFSRLLQSPDSKKRLTAFFTR